MNKIKNETIKRFTQRTENGGIRYEGNDFIVTCYPANNNLRAVDKMAERLCELEDAVESGKLDTVKNGATVHLPVKFDTPLFFLWSRHQAINYVQHTSGIYETTNWKYSLAKNGIYITTTGKSVSYCGKFLHKLGETVFLTKEEAEAKFKELEGKIK